LKGRKICCKNWELAYNLASPCCSVCVKI